VFVYISSDSSVSTMSNELLGVGQERADATPSQGDALVGDLVEAKPRFQCMDCNKSYSTKKSLQV
jgi:hypothetical protein